MIARTSAAGSSSHVHSGGEGRGISTGSTVAAGALIVAPRTTQQVTTANLTGFDRNDGVLPMMVYRSGSTAGHCLFRREEPRCRLTPALTD